MGSIGLRWCTSLQITGSHQTNVQEFGILTGENLVWPDKLTRNNLKQNLKFHSVGHRWDYTVTCLMVPNITHNVQCGSLFCGIIYDKTVYTTIIHTKIKLSDQINFVSGQNFPLEGQVTCWEKKIICRLGCTYMFVLQLRQPWITCQNKVKFSFAITNCFCKRTPQVDHMASN